MLTPSEKRTLWRVLLVIACVFWVLIMFAVAYLAASNATESQDLSQGHTRPTISHESPSAGPTEAAKAPSERELVMEWLNGGGLALLTKLNDDITAAGNATTQEELKQKCQIILDDVKAMKKLPLFPYNEASAYLTAYLSAEEDAMVTCLKGDYASAT